MLENILPLSDTMMAVLSFAVTIIAYYLSKIAYQRFHQAWLAPMLIAPLAVIAIVLLMNIPLTDYFRYTHYLVLMLGPATVAFAVPIYQQRKLIMSYPLTLLIGVCTGLLLGMLCTWALVNMFPLPPELAHSLIVRSVSTPFAIEATASFGGIPDITAMTVVMTGVIGMLVCEPVFRAARIRSALAKGVALGAASHGAGTAKAHELGQEEGVIASLTMIFAGIAMVLGAPLFSMIF